MINQQTQKSPTSQDEAYAELELTVYKALETYSNVHRGSGHHSDVTTQLYEQSRLKVLDYLGLSKGAYRVIFCTPRRAAALIARLKPGSYKSVTSMEIGIPLGITAVAVRKNAFPKGAPTETGGGTTNLVAADWVIWAGAPDKFEAGTPAIINAIAFAKALELVRQFGPDIFKAPEAEPCTLADLLYLDELDEYSGEELLNQLRLTLIGRGFQVPTKDGLKPYINLDNGASTPTFSPIWYAVSRTWRQPIPVQQEIIQEVRLTCAGMLGAPTDSYQAIFTTNTTEAINLAAESMSRESEPGVEPVFLTTLLEHSSNDLPWRMIKGATHIRLSIDSDGFIDLKELEGLLIAHNQNHEHGNKRIRLLAISGASNVLGTYNNLKEISAIVHQYGAKLLMDAAQLIAHREVSMEDSGIDFMAFSAHKIYAPFGCGVLMVKKGLLRFNPAEMEIIQSSGEENAGGIIGLGKALVLLQRIGMDVIRKEEQALTARMINGLNKIPGLRIFGIKDTHSPQFSQKGGVIVFEVKGIMSSGVAKELSKQAGIGVRYGCHCAHSLIKHLLGVSPSLERFQRFMLTLLPKMRLPGLARVSLGIENTEDEIDTLIAEVGKIAAKTKK